ncbi:type II toxin-antitoxin system RelE/ParE family toxin [Orbaceae bacterium ac157xtp]
MFDNINRNLVTSDEFDEWICSQTKGVQIKILSKLQLLLEFGPLLGRPDVDSVYGSIHPNMKELRLSYKNQPIRIFFAFDPIRDIFVCCGGMKGDKRFYKSMLKKADRIFSAHLQQFS